MMHVGAITVCRWDYLHRGRALVRIIGRRGLDGDGAICRYALRGIVVKLQFPSRSGIFGSKVLVLVVFFIYP
jgi:hypothetical protein